MIALFFASGSRLSRFAAALCLVLGGIVGGSVVAPPPAAAQSPEVSLTAERRSVEIGVEPAFQRLREDGNTLEQWSSRLWLSVPLGASTTAWARTQAAATSAGAFERLDGWGDVQVGLSSAWSIGPGSLVGALSVNVPSGRQQIRDDQIATSVLIGQNAFEMDVVSFGQGWSVAPALTWAMPVGERVVVGLGGSYRYLGSYAPIAGVDLSYVPGNEVLVNAGVDVRLRPRTAWSLDVAYTLFGTDQFDGLDVFEPANRWTLTTQLRSNAGRRDARLMARYTGRGQSSLPAAPDSPLDAESLQALPQSLLGRADLRLGLLNRLDVAVHALAAHYAETDVSIGEVWDLSTARTLGQIGGGPIIGLSRTVSWHPQAAYTFGSFDRLTARFALVWRQ